MIHIHQKLFVSMVTEAHGQAGGDALRKLLEFIRTFYQHFPPDLRKERLLILKTLDDGDISLPGATGIEVFSLSGVSQITSSPLVIQTFNNGRVMLYNFDADPTTLASNAVVYAYHDREEIFYARGKSATVDRISPAYPSNFAIPTFVDLRAALDLYQKTMIRHSSCLIFQVCWYDANRLFFINGPEGLMRDSLTQYLKTCLRGDVEVRPEQNVNDKNPVDIKVTWFMWTNRLALIEIKWLGKSRNEKGITNDYSASRARAGAKQLAEYLDQNKQQAPVHETRGYLVVIDGRRAKTTITTEEVKAVHGLKYSNEEIRYSPKFHEKRTDFEVPIRMFAEPLVK